MEAALANVTAVIQACCTARTRAGAGLGAAAGRAPPPTPTDAADFRRTRRIRERMAVGRGGRMLGAQTLAAGTPTAASDSRSSTVWVDFPLPSGPDTEISTGRSRLGASRRIADGLAATARA